MKCNKPSIQMSDSQRLKNWKRNCTEWNSSTTLWSSNRTKSPLKCCELSTRRRILNLNILPVSKNRSLKRINLKLQTSSRAWSKERDKLKQKSWSHCNRLRKKSRWKKVNSNKSVKPSMSKLRVWESWRIRTISWRLKKFWQKSERTLMY